MKKITINTISLKNAVETASSFAEKEGDFIGKIVLEGKNNLLEVKAFDGVETIICKNISFESSEKSFSAFSIDGKKLSTALKVMKSDKVEVSLKDNYIVIKSDTNKVKIETLAKVQEIDITFDGKQSFKVSNHIEALKKALHSVDTNNPKYELNGVLLEKKGDKLAIVSTDTLRLVVVKENIDNVSDFSVIIPKHGIINIIKLFEGYDIEANIDETSLSINTEMISYSTKLINGKYPSWERIVPTSFKEKIEIEAAMLKLLVEEASIFNQEITIQIKDNQIVVMDFDKNTKATHAFESTSNIAFGIKATSVLDFIKSLDKTEKSIFICFNEAFTPIVLSASTEYNEVMMPITISDVSAKATSEEKKAA